MNCDCKFSKDEFLKSKSFNFSKDVISACLLDNKLYTKKEAECIINDYLKNKV
ncbi:MAG TPA: hypothetical protein IAD10_05880 [Candidatus Fimicola cottocaccae]|uniref:hypothetical protein n=1 Tax=Tyzzerella sp. An114 TaxID=1965545 RepID=UPI001302A5EA|nr:hypothetical protein [Tyzzerella sp. An114]HIT73168.1 hypothetical protein [Candidatus Fimicola cottocaccae]